MLLLDLCRLGLFYSFACRKDVCFVFFCMFRTIVGGAKSFFYCILHVRIRLLKAWTCLILLW